MCSNPTTIYPSEKNDYSRREREKERERKRERDLKRSMDNDKTYLKL